MKMLAIVFFLQTLILVGAMKPSGSEMKPLEPPELDWQPCSCNGLTRGLTDGDIIKLNMYLSRDDCRKEE